MEKHFYHMFANGDDAKNFITNTEDFKAAFNRLAICSVLSGAKVVAASVEDSHPHVLLWGTDESCQVFMSKYVFFSIRYITNRRGDSDGVKLNCELYEISDESYLMNVASYVIIQATKDGKAVMPYDYRYGTGALYFRSPGSIMPWEHDEQGRRIQPKILKTLPQREQHALCNTKESMPGEWMVYDGIIHPGCWVDVARFESIYKTHNCFRVFMASSKARDEVIMNTMSHIRGISVEDMEARHLCSEMCLSMFGVLGTRSLNAQQRLQLALGIRRKYFLSVRQISALTRIPECELRKYVK